jgi:alpha/beta superfamily hydrolase
MPLLYPPDALTIEAVRFPAGDCQIEGELIYPEGEPTGIAVFAGPHPLLGGSMHNNIVRRLGDGLAQYGLASLRFNYRKVGSRDGVTAEQTEHLATFWRTSRTPMERHYLQDLFRACTFLRAAVGRDLPLVLAGYSFGCSLLPAVIQPGATLAALILVAPTVGTHDYAGFETVATPKLVIAPEGDFAAHDGELSRWFARLPGRKHLLRPRLDSHFFRGHEDWLVVHVNAFLDREWRYVR